MDEKQVTYNEKLLLLSKSTGVPLIAGTDTHVLNAEHEKEEVSYRHLKTLRLMVKNVGT